jgi:hypothetical protein
MKDTRISCHLVAALCLAGAVPLMVLGQGFISDDEVGGPLTGRQPVAGAPFSADAITNVRLMLTDGSTLEQKTTAQYYRDSAGRVRVELRMDGLPPPRTLAERHIRTFVSPAPGQEPTLTLDSETRTAHILPRFALAYAAGGGREIAIPIGGVRFLVLKRAQDMLTWKEAPPGKVIDELLGSRRIDGLETIGRRVTITISTAEAADGNARQLIDERWQSPALRLIVAARSTDTRLGDVEYRLANIRRADPPASLFEVPGDYTFDQTQADSGEGGWISLTPLDAYPRLRTRSR